MQFTPLSHTQAFQSLDSDTSPFTAGHFTTSSWGTPTYQPLCPETTMMDVISPQPLSQQDHFPTSALPTTPLSDQVQIPSPASTAHPSADDPYWVQLYEAMSTEGSIPSLEPDKDGMIVIDLPAEIMSQYSMDNLMWMTRKEDFRVEGDVQWACGVSIEYDTDNFVIEIADMSEIYESFLAGEFSDTDHI